MKLASTVFSRSEMKDAGSMTLLDAGGVFAIFMSRRRPEGLRVRELTMVGRGLFPVDLAPDASKLQTFPSAWALVSSRILAMSLALWKRA